MEITLNETKDIEVVPEQFQKETNPPKFVFKHPTAADVVDFQIYSDISRTAAKCFLRFENKPVLKKDGKVLDYSSYEEFIELGTSPVINAIHSEVSAAMLTAIYGLKEKAEKTEKKSE